MSPAALKIQEVFYLEEYTLHQKKFRKLFQTQTKFVKGMQAVVAEDASYLQGLQAFSLELLSDMTGACLRGVKCKVLRVFLLQ